MTIRADHLRTYVVAPTLKYIAEKTGNQRINSTAAIELLMMTIAHESHSGEWLRQYPSGPARGIAQMEPVTYADLWASYLNSRAELADAVRSFAAVRSVVAGTPAFEEVIGNLPFAVAMARVRYLPAKPPIPDPNDLYGLANYHVEFYNRGGDARPEELVRDYRRYVLDLV